MERLSNFDLPSLRPCTLTLIETRSTCHKLRTQVVAGWSHLDPAPRKRFVLFSRALATPDDWRLVYTSPVVEVLQISPGHVEFWTENSRYSLLWHEHGEAMPPAQAFSVDLARDLASEVFS